MSLHFRLLIALALLGMCFAAGMPQRRGVSDEDKKVILELHNNFRKNVSPTATNMQKMYWSDALAKAAQNWVDQCVRGHDTNAVREKLADMGISVGQNFAAGQTSWTKVVSGWHSEVQWYDYDTNAKIPTTPADEYIGHYTMVVLGPASLVGCAYASCNSRYKHHYVCNYAYTNLRDQRPYINGTSCDACKSNCVEEKLCDCPKICMNQGTLDLESCTCKCQFGWTGDSCEICPKEEAGWCGKHKNFYKEDCSWNGNLPPSCPKLCETGKCPDIIPNN